MKVFRVLYVDDDSLRRGVVDVLLGHEPGFDLMSCRSGQEALTMAADWQPDLVLCDAPMLDTDDPAMPAQLRYDVRTAKIPVIFLTALAEADEVDRLMQLGAFSVIAKPFDPMTLAETLRCELQSTKPAPAHHDFDERLRQDASSLAAYRQYLFDGPGGGIIPEGLLTCVHKLAGAAGVFDHMVISSAASALESAIVGAQDCRVIDGHLVLLLDCIAARVAPLQPVAAAAALQKAHLVTQTFGT